MKNLNDIEVLKLNEMINARGGDDDQAPIDDGRDGDVIIWE